MKWMLALVLGLAVSAPALGGEIGVEVLTVGPTARRSQWPAPGWRWWPPMSRSSPRRFSAAPRARPTRAGA